jgi:hypothetical protein
LRWSCLGFSNGDFFIDPNAGIHANVSINPNYVVSSVTLIPRPIDGDRAFLAFDFDDITGGTFQLITELSGYASDPS